MLFILGAMLPIGVIRNHYCFVSTAVAQGRLLALFHYTYDLELHPSDADLFANCASPWEQCVRKIVPEYHDVHAMEVFRIGKESPLLHMRVVNRFILGRSTRELDSVNLLA